MSYSKPDTSFINLTPILIPFFIIFDFRVSKEIGTFLLNNFKILPILNHSNFSSIDFDPGLVDSPPISIKLAPALYKLIACLTPLSFLLNFPPSEKLSGVKFNIPIIFGILFNLSLEKFFFFEVILIKSKIIFFLINLVISLFHL